MIYLILTILSSAMISVFMRYSERHISAKIPMLSVNYLVCTLLTLWQSGGAALHLPQAQTALTLSLGLVNGAVFLLALVLIQYTVFKSGVVLSSVFSKMGSLVVPLVVAIGIFGEAPTVVQVFGAALSALSIFLLNGQKTGKATGIVSLLLLFLMQGAASALSKVFEQLIGAAQFDHFLFYTFASALVFSIVFCILKREVPGKWEVLFGMLVGIPNFFSSRLLLWHWTRCLPSLSIPFWASAELWSCLWPA